MKPGRNYPGAKLLHEPLEHLGALSERMAEAYGDRPALQVPRDGALMRLSYRDFARQVRGMAERLRRLGVRPGDRVAILGDNSPEWIVAAFGVFSAGAIAVPLDPQLSEAELWNLLAHCTPRGVFASPRLLPLVRRALGDDAFVIALSPEEFSAPAEPMPSQPPAPSAFGACGSTAGEVAAIFYTSGTTGEPKGVMLTHRNLLFDAERCAEILYVKDGDNGFALLPLHHAYSFTCMLIILICGGPTTLPVSLKPDSVVATMRETQVTVLPAVPLLIDHLAKGVQERLAQLPPLQARLMRGLIRLSARLRPVFGAGLSRRLCRPILAQLGGLRLVVAGGAPLNPDSALFFHALGITILNGYGLTETSPVLTLTPTPWQPGDGVGKPLRGVELRLVDPDSEGWGEVHVRSECVMAGYYRNPEATAQVWREGWFNTQDRGRLDRRGNVILHGRSKNVIVLANGKNVYPEDVERHYGQSRLIRELCVIRGQEADGSEFPFGVLVPDLQEIAALHPDATSPEALRAVLGKELTRLSAGLADYKRLKRFEVSLEPMPLTTSRKIRRQQVQDAYGVGVRPPSR